MIVFHDVKQDSPEWLALRKGLWTGSKAIRLLQDKPLPIEYQFEGNIYTKRGKTLENIALKEYERWTSNYARIKRPGFVTNTVYPNAGYSPDAIDRRMLLEVKCLNGKRHEDLAKGFIATEFLCQIYFGMIITGLRHARLLAFNPEYEQQLTVLEVPYDKTIGNNIRKKLRLDMKNRQLS